MLEVMSAGSTGLTRTGESHGILLDSWDKSSPLIKELERTVNFAERKCGDLMQQLHFYKEYYEKWAQIEHVNHLCHKKKFKKICRQAPDEVSSSENEFEKANQYLYKKIKNKIEKMNNEIIEANRKIHSKRENYFPPVKNQSMQPEENSPQEFEQPFLAFENKTCKSEPTMTSYDVYTGDSEGLNVTGKQSSKSVPMRTMGLKNTKKDSAFSKRRFSSIQRYKLRSKSLPQGVRRKFGFGGFFEVFEPQKTFSGSVKSKSKSKMSLNTESLKSIKSKRSKTRVSESKRITPKSSRRAMKPSKSDVRNSIKNEKQSEANKCENSRLTSNDSQKVPQKEINACKALVPTGNPDANRTRISLNADLKTLMSKPNALLPFLRRPIPFIPCSSTSKSFNLGLNVQQVLSLLKHKRHSVTLQAIVRNSMQAASSIAEPTVNTLFISQTTTSHSHMTSSICPAREESEDSFSFVTHNRSQCSILKQVQTIRAQEMEGKTISPQKTIIEVNKLERPEDVWVVEQPDPASREVGNTRSRCTCFPSKHCVDYHKVLRQYTGWRLPAGSQGETQPSILCPKPKLYTVPSRESIGYIRDETEGRIELMKVHNDLHNLTRKYSSLQEQISQKSLGDYEANLELDAMESELAVREIEFKDILNFYNQLMMLKEKLKSLRARNEQNQRAPGRPRSRKDPLRPTPSMALAKALKKIQGLQDKIKLIDAP